jgi:hypothetical protein
MGIAPESLETAERQIPAEEMGAVRSPEAEGQATADSIGSLLQRVAASSIGEIDGLIDEMTTMRNLLQMEAERVQREIIIYAHLSQLAMRTTKSISEILNAYKIDRDEFNLVLDEDDERCRTTTGLRPDGDVTPHTRINEDAETAGLHRPKRSAQNKA